MYYLLKPEVFLRELRRERFKYHLQYVFRTLILTAWTTVTIAVLIPDLSDKLLEYLALHVAYLLADLQREHYRPIPSTIGYRVNEFCAPDVLQVV